MPAFRNSKQERFCLEYMVDRNGAAAARRVGYSARTARTIAHELLTKPNIRRRVSELESELAERLNVRAEDVVQRYIDIAFASVTDLVAIRVVPCRHCHGIEHRHQWRTEDEFRHARDRWLALADCEHRLEAEPSAAGGFGYSSRREPYADCPYCDGFGIPRLEIKDLRFAPNAARHLFAGARQGPHGIEVKLNDQMAALDALARHLGLFAKQNDRDFPDNSLAEYIVAKTRTAGSKPTLNRGGETGPNR